MAALAVLERSERYPATRSHARTEELLQAGTRPDAGTSRKLRRGIHRSGEGFTAGHGVDSLHRWQTSPCHTRHSIKTPHFVANSAILSGSNQPGTRRATAPEVKNRI